MSDNEYSHMPGTHFLYKRFESYNGKIPFIVSDLVARLEALGAESVEGIFRLSGQKSVVQRLCSELDRGPVSDWCDYDDVNVVSCTLKRYFSMKVQYDPLITPDVENELSTSGQAILSESSPLPAIASLLSKLPPTNLHTLGYLCRYLHKIHGQSEANRMDASNLSICFSPALFSAPNGIVGSSPMKVLELAISDFESVFGPDVFNESFLMNGVDIQRHSDPIIDASDLSIESKRRELRRRSQIGFNSNQFTSILGLKRPTRPPPTITL